MSVYEKSSAASANCQIFVIELKIPFSFHSDQQNPHEQWTWPDWRGETGFKWRHSGLQHQTGLSLRRVRSLWQNFRGHDKRRGKPLLIRTQHGRDLVFSGNFSQFVVFGGKWRFDDSSLVLRPSGNGALFFRAPTSRPVLQWARDNARACQVGRIRAQRVPSRLHPTNPSQPIGQSRQPFNALLPKIAFDYSLSRSVDIDL